MLQDEIFSLKEELIKSKKYLLTPLCNRYYFQKVKLCLLRQQYLNKYEKSILNYATNKDNKKTKLLFNINDSIDLEFKELLKILNDKNIKLKDLPRIFPINEYNYKYFTKNSGNKTTKNNNDNNNKDNNNKDKNINNQDIELIDGIFG